MLPIKLTKLLPPGKDYERGIGCTWMDTEILGKGTYGHGSATNATLRISPVHELVVSMTRNGHGRDFPKYHERFLLAIIDAIQAGGTEMGILEGVLRRPGFSGLQRAQ